ncbi:hypothetical protein ACFWFI_10780 [Streptomyces sp. NPDC060209]|uniref:hypothetical protein n=1 Tax=Streptomyces sp. NPDC060209 TaxID=3347073 RepID=UPI00365254DA
MNGSIALLSFFAGVEVGRSVVVDAGAPAPYVRIVERRRAKCRQLVATSCRPVCDAFGVGGRVSGSAASGHPSARSPSATDACGVQGQQAQAKQYQVGRSEHFVGRHVGSVDQDSDGEEYCRGWRQHEIDSFGS